MIKLIASDLDGTILLNGAQSVDKSFYEVVSKLTSKGIIFAPASGRQCESLIKLFQPVSNELMYISENGALVRYKGKALAKTPMDRNLALEIIEDVYKINNCEVLVSGERTAYIKPKSTEYEYRMTKVVNYQTTFVEDFRDIKEDILKVAVCDMSGIDNSKDYLLNRWKGRVLAAVSGKLYLDFTDLSVSKGNAIRQVQKLLSLSPKECMAFGDNYNDIEMLDSVSEAFVMNTANSDIRKHGKYICENVEETLRKIFLI